MEDSDRLGVTAEVDPREIPYQTDEVLAQVLRVVEKTLRELAATQVEGLIAIRLDTAADQLSEVCVALEPRAQER